MPKAAGCLRINTNSRRLSRERRENRMLDAFSHFDEIKEMFELGIDLFEDAEMDQVTAILESMAKVLASSPALQRPLIEYRRIKREGESKESWLARNMLRYGVPRSYYVKEEREVVQRG